MRRYLTVSEVSKLLNLSAHTIRYYDKEGLISTRHESENGYRLFDYNDVYTLNAIILLRESGIPIKDIKELLRNYSKDSYKSKLMQSYDRISKEIEKLQLLKKDIEQTLKVVDEYEDNVKSFMKVKLPKRYYRLIKTSNYDMNYSIKELFDVYVKKNIDMSCLYRSDIIYLLNDNNISLCIEETQVGLDDMITYEDGYYVDYTFVVEEDDEIFERIEEMFEYFSMNNLNYEGNMILIIGVNTSMIKTDSYIARLQMKIKE